MLTPWRLLSLVCVLVFCVVLGAFVGVLVGPGFADNRPSHGGRPAKPIQLRIARGAAGEQWLDNYDVFFSPLDLTGEESTWGLVVFVLRGGGRVKTARPSHQVQVDLIGFDGRTVYPLLVVPSEMSASPPTIVPVDFLGPVKWSAVDFSRMSVAGREK